MATGAVPWDEKRIERLERDVEKLRDEDRQDVLLARLDDLQKRVDRMALFAMSAAGLLVAVLGVLVAFIR